MTRLVDVERLVAYFENLKGDTIAVTDAAAVADNAPTVCCAECAGQDKDCTIRAVLHPKHDSFGCSYFERRTP